MPEVPRYDDSPAVQWFRGADVEEELSVRAAEGPGNLPEPCRRHLRAIASRSRRSEGWTVALSSLASEPCSPRRSRPRRSRRGAHVSLMETSAPDPARVAWWDAFRQQMRELGYVEAQNVTYEARFADGRIDRLPAL